MDTDSPMLRVGTLTFRGSWHETIGSQVILKDGADKMDIVDIPTKCVNFELVYLVPKKDQDVVISE